MAFHTGIYFYVMHIIILQVVTIVLIQVFENIVLKLGRNFRQHQGLIKKYDFIIYITVLLSI